MPKTYESLVERQTYCGGAVVVGWLFHAVFVYCLMESLENYAFGIGYSAVEVKNYGFYHDLCSVV